MNASINNDELVIKKMATKISVVRWSDLGEEESACYLASKNN